MLSGNRNFEARIHQSVKANFLMSPPLVVAFAIAGRIDIDLTREPLAVVDGREVYLRDVWPSMQEIDALLGERVRSRRVPARLCRLRRPEPALEPDSRRRRASVYEWDPASLYIREPPYFDPSMAARPSAEVSGARALAIFGDSITTDHISPAGAIKPTSPAGGYLRDQGVPVEDFNSYGARRGNHEVMVRGTFANVRIRNLMVPGVEGGVTRHQPDGERMGIYDAAERYRAEGVPLVVIAGQDYGAGSSRDWAAKGTRLLGVRAVIARGFERIHRSNLIGMGVLPCQFPEGVSAQTLGLDGTERFDLALEGTCARARRRPCTSSVGTAGANRCRSCSGSTRRSRPRTSRRAESCPTCSSSWRATPTRGRGPNPADSRRSTRDESRGPYGAMVEQSSGSSEHLRWTQAPHPNISIVSNSHASHRSRSRLSCAVPDKR